VWRCVVDQTARDRQRQTERDRERHECSDVMRLSSEVDESVIRPLTRRGCGIRSTALEGPALPRLMCIIYRRPRDMRCRPVGQRDLRVVRRRRVACCWRVATVSSEEGHFARSLRLLSSLNERRAAGQTSVTLRQHQLCSSSSSNDFMHSPPVSSRRRSIGPHCVTGTCISQL